MNEMITRPHVVRLQKRLRSFALASHALFLVASIDLLASILRSRVSLQVSQVIGLTMIYVIALGCQVLVVSRYIRATDGAHDDAITILHVQYSSLIAAILIASTLIFRS